MDEKVEFINLRVTAVGLVPEVKLGKTKAGAAGNPLKDRRPAYFFGHGFIETPVYDRARLAPGETFSGPALVEEVASMTVIAPETDFRVDLHGSLIVTFRSE